MNKWLISLLVVFLVFISSVFAADPVWDAISDKIAYEDQELEFTVNATGTGALTYSADIPQDMQDDGAEFNAGTQTFSWTPSEVKINGYDVTFTVTDDMGTPGDTSDDASADKKVNIKIYPDFCDEDDIKDKIDIGDIDFEDEDYRIGDVVSVTVENVEAQTDLEDVSVELYLYNVDENKKIDKWKSDDEFDLDDGEEEDFDFEFEIPNDENIGSNDKYVLFAVATGQDDDDDYCTIATEEIDIERETHDVLIKQVTVTPSEIEAGGSVSLVVEVENIGTKKEEDVYVRIRESELGLDEQSAYFTLDKYSKSRNDAIQRFMIDVPENAEEKSYQIEVLVYFDDGDETVSKFAMLKVKAVEVPEVPVADASVSTEGVQTTVTEGSSFSIPVKVKNLASETITFEVKLANVEAWAEEVSPMTLTLAEGQESTVFVYVKPKTGVAGMHSATVNVESGGNIVATTTLSFNVEESAEETSGITGFSVMNIAKSTTFWWIVGDIVLIVIAIFFIRMLFSKRQ